MILSNKEIIFNIENENDSIKIIGIFRYSSQKTIKDFNGTIYKISDNSFIGSFKIDEDTNERYNKNLMDIPIDYEDIITTLLKSTLVDIKNELKNE